MPINDVMRPLSACIKTSSCCVRARACARARMRACVCACAHACVRASMHACGSCWVVRSCSACSGVKANSGRSDTSLCLKWFSTSCTSAPLVSAVPRLSGAALPLLGGPASLALSVLLSPPLLLTSSWSINDKILTLVLSLTSWQFLPGFAPPGTRFSKP